MFTLLSLLLAPLIAQDPPSVRLEPVTLEIPGPVEQPDAVLDSEGRVFLVMRDPDGIRHLGLRYGRVYVATRVPLQDPADAGKVEGPRIAVSPNGLCVTATVSNEASETRGDVLSWFSRDRGRTWEGPGRANRVDGSAQSGLQDLTGSIGGDPLACAWMDRRNDRWAVYASLSWDGGLTWMPDFPVQQLTRDRVCEGAVPSIAFRTPSSYCVSWRERRDAHGEVWAALIGPEWNDFQPVIALGDGTTDREAPSDSGPVLARDSSGRIGAVWTRDGQIQFCELGQPARRVGEGSAPTLGGGPNGFWMAWISPGGDLMVQGPRDARPHRVAEHSAAPVWASAPSAEVVPKLVWEDRRERLRLTYAVAAPASHLTVNEEPARTSEDAGMLDAVRMRLEALGFFEATVWSPGVGWIVVDLPGANSADAELANLALGMRGDFLIRALANERDDPNFDVEVQKFEQWRQRHPDLPIHLYNEIPAEQRGPEAGIEWLPVREGVELHGAYAGWEAVPTRLAEVFHPDKTDEDSWSFDGEDLASLGPGMDAAGFNAVRFELKPERKQAFGDFTEHYEGRPLAMVLDGVVFSAPNVMSRLPGGGMITGGPTGFSFEEMRGLITSMRGSLDATLGFQRESRVDRGVCVRGNWPER